MKNSAPLLIIAPFLLSGCIAGAAVSLAGDVVEGTVRGAGEVAEGAYNVSKGAVDLAIPDSVVGGQADDAIYEDPYD
ncbi:MAG: hypothetical protein AAF719_13510 [Pseudomonadota bacterium]